jgi:hypothetical protein
VARRADRQILGQSFDHGQYERVPEIHFLLRLSLSDFW